jgi:hypothetical protein
MMLRSGRPSGSLHALVVAIEAAEAVDPYPRLAKLMQRIVAQEAAMRRAQTSWSHGLLR